MEACAAEDPDYDIEREKQLLFDRLGFVELTEENEELFWYMHDVMVFGKGLADELSDLEINEYSRYSVALRLRAIAGYLNRIRYGSK